MPAVYLCDGGCGESTSDATHFAKRGVALTRLYCPTCIASVDAHLAARDDAHTAAAAEYMAAIAAFSKQWQDENPKGRLPDEPG